MPSKKSIAFVANTSWSIYKFRLYLIKQLIESGFNIYILAPRDRYTSHFRNLPGLTYIELKKFKGKSISPLADIQLYRELLGHYRRIRPELIFHYTVKANIFGSMAAARIQCPSISVITGLGYAFSRNTLLQTAVKLFYRQILQKNAEVWFLNKDDQDVFIKERLINREKTFLLPGEGVDAEAFYPAPYELRQDSEDKDEGRPIVYLLIGRIIKHKGIYEFVQAAQLLKRKGFAMQFLLLGFFDEGNPVAISRQEVEEWVSQDHIRFLGETDNVAPYIEKADCIVLPSYREGMPLSLLEGASMCKALIAADTAGCREIISDGVNGYLCHEQDGADLADKMERYYWLPAADKRQMGLEGRERVLRHFTKEIVTGIYIDKLKAINQPPPGK